MKTLRILAGWACIAIALAVAVAALRGGLPAHAATSALIAHLPTAAYVLAPLSLGLWLLFGARRQ